MTITGYGIEFDAVTGRWIAWLKYDGSLFQDKFATRADAEAWLRQMTEAAGLTPENNHDRR
jgi:hypothetical protein